MTAPRKSSPAAILAIILISYFMILLDNSVIFTGLPRAALTGSSGLLALALVVVLACIVPATAVVRPRPARPALLEPQRSA